MFEQVSIDEQKIGEDEMTYHTFDSDDEYTRSLSLDAKVDFKFGLFHAELSSRYSSSHQRSESHHYAQTVYDNWSAVRRLVPDRSKVSASFPCGRGAVARQAER